MVKKGLGRGLNSLFGDYGSDEPITEEEKAAQKEIEISLLDRNEDQPRKKFDEKSTYRTC